MNDAFRGTEVGVKQHETWWCSQGSSAVVLSRPWTMIHVLSFANWKLTCCLHL